MPTRTTRPRALTISSDIGAPPNYRIRLPSRRAFIGGAQAIGMVARRLQLTPGR